MDTSFTAPIVQPDGSTEFDNILSSIGAAIGGYLKTKPTVTGPAYDPGIAPTATSDLLVLLVIGVGIYFLLR